MDDKNKNGNIIKDTKILKAKKVGGKSGPGQKSRVSDDNGASE